MRVHEIYIGDFSNISAQLKIYQRFLKYIGATQIISAIFQIYRLTDKKRQKEEAVSTQPLPSILEAPPEQ
ncbi:hypothetical protein ADK17_16970 [Bacillus anthracis]|nr:hypothetical protein ADK17_16970 [Bacillus anthracis]